MLLKSKTVNYKISKNWDDLNFILKPSYNISILQRNNCSEIIKLIELAVENKIFPEISEVINSNEIDDILENKFSPLKLIYEAGYDALKSDIKSLFKKFCEITGQDKVDFLFSFVNKTKCPLFHFDYNLLRMICTYYGEGTIWAENENVNFNKIGYGKNEELIKEQKKLKKMKEFEVGILKGSKFSENYSYPVIHKSPVVSEEKEIRVLLRMDIFEYKG